jgi:hypothetical protein
MTKSEYIGSLWIAESNEGENGEFQNLFDIKRDSLHALSAPHTYH